MERVKGQQLHLRRVLDRQLEDIEHSYRQSEVKREREIRSLGVDLTRMKTFTKDVDQIFTTTTEDPVFRPQIRRASLPAIISPRPLTSPAIPIAATRQRRLSVVTPPSRSRLELMSNVSTSSGNVSPIIAASSPNPFDHKAANPPIINGTKNPSRRSSNGSDAGGEDSRSGPVVPVRKRSQEQLSSNALSPSSSPQSSVMTRDDTRKGSTASVPPSQGDPTRRASKSETDPQATSSEGKSPVREGGRRGSLDGSSRTTAAVAAANGKTTSTKQVTTGKPIRRKSKSLEPEAANISHNETKVYIHQDGQQPILVSNKTSPRDGNDETDDDMGSMFEKRNSRRASEPALGGHFLRFLQAKANNDDIPIPEVKNHHALSPAEEELRKSIVKDLPSTIVAEEDEDRYNEENGVVATATERTTIKATASTEIGVKSEIKAANIDSVTPKRINPPLTRQDSNGKMEKRRGSADIGKRNTRPSIAQQIANVESKEQSKSDGKLKKSQQRRKSEGDILRYARVWKLQADNTKSPRKEGKAETSDDGSGDSSKLGIWDAVRKCRYIRGYNPPEMAEPEDLSEFVFGN